MIKCRLCNKGIATDNLQVCFNCIKNNFDRSKRIFKQSAYWKYPSIKLE